MRPNRLRKNAISNGCCSAESTRMTQFIVAALAAPTIIRSAA
jgi:hypothetical protein